jgi:hypothetical protein
MTKAVIIDKNDRKVEELNGSVKDGLFRYRKGGFLGLGSKSEQEECDYDNLVPIFYSTMFGLIKGSYKAAYYRYKNGKLTQITWNELKKTSVFSDANNAFKQMKLAEEITLKRPTSGAEQWAWLFIVITVIAGVTANALVANSASHNIQQATAPMQNLTVFMKQQSAYQDAAFTNLTNITKICIIDLRNFRVSNVT